MRYFLIAITLLLSACAPARFVQPLDQGQYAVTASLGGPLITYSDLTIPTPLSSLAVGYGITNELTGFGGLHLTSLAFKNLQIDLGVTQRLLQQDGLVPAISASPVLNIVTDFRKGAARLWPQLDLIVIWEYMPNGNTIYLNSSNWFDLTSTRANGEAQRVHWIPNLGIGHILNGSLWQYILEVKYLAIGLRNEPNVTDYHGISDHGDFGLYLGLTRKF